MFFPLLFRPTRLNLHRILEPKQVARVTKRWQSREFASAEQHFRRSLTLREQVSGSDSPLVADSLVWLGISLHAQLADSASVWRVEPFYRRVIDMGDRAGEDARVLALEACALVLNQTNKSAEAQPLSEEASAIRIRRIETLQGTPRSFNPPPVKIGGSVKAPAVMSRVDTEFSEEARVLKHGGEVRLELVVDMVGKPANIRVIKSLGFGLDEKAFQAIQQWAFQPATREGQPVSVIAVIEMNFRLL